MVVAAQFVVRPLRRHRRRLACISSGCNGSDIRLTMVSVGFRGCYSQLQPRVVFPGCRLCRHSMVDAAVRHMSSGFSQGPDIQNGAGPSAYRARAATRHASASGKTNDHHSVPPLTDCASFNFT
jgi:hypothetical protein